MPHRLRGFVGNKKRGLKKNYTKKTTQLRYSYWKSYEAQKEGIQVGDNGEIMRIEGDSIRSKQMRIMKEEAMEDDYDKCLITCKSTSGLG